MPGLSSQQAIDYCTAAREAQQTFGAVSAVSLGSRTRDTPVLALSFLHAMERERLVEKLDGDGPPRFKLTPKGERAAEGDL